MTFDGVTIVQSRSVASRKYVGMCEDRDEFNRRDRTDTAKWKRHSQSPRTLFAQDISNTESSDLRRIFESFIRRDKKLWDFKQFCRKTISSPVHKSMSKNAPEYRDEID